MNEDYALEVCAEALKKAGFNCELSCGTIYIDTENSGTYFISINKCETSE